MCFNQLSFSSITDLGLRGNKTAAKIAFWLGRPWSTETSFTTLHMGVNFTRRDDTYER